MVSTLSLSLAAGAEFRDRIRLMFCFSGGGIGTQGGSGRKWIQAVCGTDFHDRFHLRRERAASRSSEPPAEEGSRDWPVRSLSRGGLWTGSCSAWGAEVVSQLDSRSWTYPAPSTPPAASGRLDVHKPPFTFVDRTVCVPSPRASSCPATGGTGWGQQGETPWAPLSQGRRSAAAAEARLPATSLVTGLRGGSPGAASPRWGVLHAVRWPLPQTLFRALGLLRAPRFSRPRCALL